MTLRHALLSAAAALCFVACGKTETAESSIPDPQQQQPVADPTAAQAEAQTFVNAAGQASLAEIETSRLALDHAKNADVKSFAQTLIDDHLAATTALAAAASGSGLTPPATSLDEFHMRRVNDLNETDGDADFDADYAALQVDAHKDAIDLFEDYARDGDIPALRAFAEAQLPKLRAHQAHAETLNTEVHGAPASEG
jgi:putative membrane protein